VKQVSGSQSQWYYNITLWEIPTVFFDKYVEYPFQDEGNKLLGSPTCMQEIIQMHQPSYAIININFTCLWTLKNVTGSAIKDHIHVTDLNGIYLESCHLTYEFGNALKLWPNMWPNLGKPFQIAHQAKSN